VGAVRWVEFAHQAPDLAAAGHKLLYNFGPGLGYLATVRRDGSPRLHPVCPVVANDGLYLFIGNQSPKKGDLLRDGRFALHSFPHPEVDDEFCVSGSVVLAEEPEVRRIVYEAYVATGAHTSDDTLFELLIDRALHAKYGTRPSWPPAYTRWQPTT
jgi:hypothetical protein